MTWSVRNLAYRWLSWIPTLCENFSFQRPAVLELFAKKVKTWTHLPEKPRVQTKELAVHALRCLILLMALQ